MRACTVKRGEHPARSKTWDLDGRDLIKGSNSNFLTGRIVGVDEAGRGPWAGPVVAAACFLPEGSVIEGLDDSKKLSIAARLAVFERILSLPEVDYGLGVIEASIIDQVNILQATFQAMIAAVCALSQQPDFLLVDGDCMPPTQIPGQAIIGGDGLHPSIAAASVLAKVSRDKIMEGYHERWPEYGFSNHKGYGTQGHRLALAEHGPCPIHRMSFKPLTLKP